MKFLEMMGKVLLYFIIYISTTLIGSFSYGIFYGIMHMGKVDENEISAVIFNNYFTITAAAAIFSFIIYILLFKTKEANLFERCKFKKLSLKVSLIILLSSIGLTFFSCSLVNLLSGIFPSYRQISETLSSGTTSSLSLISMILIIPIFEEILFRGLIFYEFKKNLNIVLAVILQGLIFAAAHGNMLLGIYTFIMGIVLAVLYIKTESIIASMIFHMSYNLLGSLVIPSILSIVGGYYIGFIILGAVILGISLSLLHKDNRNKSIYCCESNSLR